MNLQTLKLKASTLCAGGTLLVFGGFLTVNLAGCGGGGGGLISMPTPRPVGATFRIVQQDSQPSRGGTITLTGNGQTFTGTADNKGVVVLSNLPPGTYNATFTSFTSNGTALPSTTRSLTVTPTGTQNYQLVQGDTGSGAFTLTGTVFANPNNADFTNCTASSAPITAPLLITVRDLNDTMGTPIISQIVRPLQDNNAPSNLRGRYTISLPLRPTSFRVEVGPADNNGVVFAGFSATTTFTEGITSLANVDVCANSNGRIPVPFSPTATPTTAPTRGFPTVGPGTPTPTVGPTNTAVPTNTVAPTNTTTPNTTIGNTTLGNVTSGTGTGTTTGNTTNGNTTINNTTLSTAGNTTFGTAGNTTINNTTLSTAGNTTFSTAGNTTVTTLNRTRR